MSNNIRKIIGIDLGNYNINTSEGFQISSTLEARHIRANKDDLQITYNGMPYTIGAPTGALNIGVKKYKKSHFKICLLTAIAKSCHDDKSVIHCNVVLGVPPEVYNNKEIVQDMKETILSWGPQNINIGGKEKEIIIHDIDVFLESGIVFTNKEKYKNAITLVVDIGGGSSDITLWHGLKLIHCKTYKDALIPLQGKIISAVNEREKTNLRPELAAEMIGQDEFIIKTEKKDISYIKEIVENFILGLTSYINQEFDVDSCHYIELISGGAVILGKWLLDEYEKAEIFEEAPFANAKLYKKIGELIWG